MSCNIDRAKCLDYSKNQPYLEFIGYKNDINNEKVCAYKDTRFNQLTKVIFQGANCSPSPLYSMGRFDMDFNQNYYMPKLQIWP
jgi:hypothetical protein